MYVWATWVASIFHSLQFSLNTPYVQSTRGLQSSSRKETNILRFPSFMPLSWCCLWTCVFFPFHHSKPSDGVFLRKLSTSPTINNVFLPQRPLLKHLAPFNLYYSIWFNTHLFSIFLLPTSNWARHWAVQGKLPDCVCPRGAQLHRGRQEHKFLWCKGREVATEVYRKFSKFWSRETSRWKGGSTPFILGNLSLRKAQHSSSQHGTE